jgi:acyl carrier protein
MGLDVVEIVLRTEEVFGVDLPDDECERVITVGDLYHLVLDKVALPYIPAIEIEGGALGQARSKLHFSGLHEWSSPDVWLTLKAIIEDQLQVNSAEITESATFADDLRCD